ncbi:MAG: hypothetical protein KVP17_001480 [Porospora cf. gigantea B]|uniref:uncharacterized protein n=1 Tax=Porospora cf. gigantea B TaxID=2853592 RepID=UPI003571C0D2|nr:MAG: hypothetical protein KVP17_001480 [Porospora cf. gigantea B]
MAEESRLDGLFTTAAQQCPGGIDELLGRFFGFLQRRTDFLEQTPAECRSVVNGALDRILDSQPKIQEVAPKPVSKPVATPKVTKKDNNGGATDNNGGATDKYRWTQTLDVVEVVIDLPDRCVGRDIKVDFQKRHLSVQIRGDVFLTGQLHYPIDVGDSLWTKEDRILSLTLEKTQQQWWSCVLEGDAAIDTQACIPETTSLSDLDGETRKVVEKMMFDQNMKAQNKPSSDEVQQQDILQKFKDMHPEMDFSGASVQY